MKTNKTKQYKKEISKKRNKKVEEGAITMG